MFDDTEVKEGCIFMLIIGLVSIPFMFLAAWVIMLLWNWLLPNLLSVPEITYWKAFGLGLLCSILFGRINFNLK